MRRKKTTLKDKVTNWAGLVILASGALAGLSGVIEFPGWAIQSLVIAGTLAGTLVAWLTGKDENGKKKSITYNQYK
jgi:hypothetical protein